MSDRTGVVWIAGESSVSDLQDQIIFSGYWDSGTDVLEEMPDVSSSVEAIRWGLDRTDDVRIRFDYHSYWWAGVGPMPEDPEGVFVGFVALRD